MNTRVVVLPKLCNDTSPTDSSVGDFCLGWELYVFCSLIHYPKGNNFNTGGASPSPTSKSVLILLADNTVLADVGAVVFAGLVLLLANEHTNILVLVQLEVAVIRVVLLVIGIVPAGIAQCSH